MFARRRDPHRDEPSRAKRQRQRPDPIDASATTGPDRPASAATRAPRGARPMAQFYTLEEGRPRPRDESRRTKGKAQHREVRLVPDGGSWRFRVADVDELARRRGLGSDATSNCPTWTSPSRWRSPGERPEPLRVQHGRPQGRRRPADGGPRPRRLRPPTPPRPRSRPARPSTTSSSTTSRCRRTPSPAPAP